MKVKCNVSFFLLCMCICLVFTNARVIAQGLKAGAGDDLTGPCVEEYTVNDAIQLHGVARGTINAVKSTSIKTKGDIKIAPGRPGMVITARKSVYLGPGFSVPKGSNLSVFVSPSPCNSFESHPAVQTNGKSTGQSAEEVPIVFPNPSNGLFYLKIPLKKRSPLGYNFEIYAADGKLIRKNEKFLNDLFTINIMGSAKGFYFIRTSDLATGKVFIKKIVVN